jgi:hypothetical protein
MLRAGTATMGSRVFDVAVQGAVVLPALDVVAAANGTLRGEAERSPCAAALADQVSLVRLRQACTAT